MSYKPGFIDPLTLVTAAVTAVTILGTLLATQAVQRSSEDRSQAAYDQVADPCKECSGTKCVNTNIPNCSSTLNECNCANGANCAMCGYKAPTTQPAAVCNPGDVDKTECSLTDTMTGDDCPGERKRTCRSDKTWSSWGACIDLEGDFCPLPTRAPAKISTPIPSKVPTPTAYPSAYSSPTPIPTSAPIYWQKIGPYCDYNNNLENPDWYWDPKYPKKVFLYMIDSVTYDPLNDEWVVTAGSKTECLYGCVTIDSNHNKKCAPAPTPIPTSAPEYWQKIGFSICYGSETNTDPEYPDKAILHTIVSVTYDPLNDEWVVTENTTECLYGCVTIDSSHQKCIRAPNRNATARPPATPTPAPTTSTPNAPTITVTQSPRVIIPGPAPTPTPKLKPGGSGCLWDSECQSGQCNFILDWPPKQCTYPTMPEPVVVYPPTVYPTPTSEYCNPNNSNDKCANNVAYFCTDSYDWAMIDDCNNRGRGGETRTCWLDKNRFATCVANE